MRKLPALLLPAALLCVVLLAAPPTPTLRVNDRPLLPRPGLLRAVFRGQLGLVTDYFWILTLNRIGRSKTPTDYRDVYAYADLATDLDPKFATVYWFAGTTIPIHLGREQYANVEESTKLLRKGTRNVPENSRTWFQLAYNLMFFHREYKEAADIITELSRRRDAPAWYSALATRLYAQAGDFDTGLSLAVMMRDGAEDEETRRTYDRRVREILQERVLQQLDAEVARYRTRHGRAPATLEALVEDGGMTRLPADPLGGRLFIGDGGRVYSSTSEFRLQVIYDERTPEGKRIRPNAQPEGMAPNADTTP
ncbi:pilus assembly protein PilG [Corallococcus sp. AB032C]|uniref:pilus assembly protein PilG n=1 Tax=Corallococcus TaxID=83461 RepID=UPI000EE0046D|nr:MULTISPECIES: pilus assembly protein PilG [Corallococcus]NPC52213.1 pilus assembly protein PilG [Corallococcus exiguus]RKH76341.1 pilus assembly protein PilG [Corallococcus sp. AB032C]